MKMVATSHSKTSKPSSKKTVSARSIFKRETIRIKRDDHVQLSEKDAADGNDKAMAIRQQNAERRFRPRVVDGRITKKADTHPLAKEFKETSKDYRQSLYEKARIEIDKTLQSLLGRFHEGILQVVAPNKGQPQSHSSSLKITAPEKYERLVLKIYQPLSLHKITRSTVDETGKHFIYVSTLEERMEQYSEQLAKRAKYLKQLQREWEVVVGKIWNLGIECLGEEMMETLFLSGNLGPAPDVTSALFISEQDISSSSSPLQDPIVITSKPNKKHVTIEAPEGYVSTPTTNHPVLLYQSSSRSAKKKMKKKKNEGDAQVKHQHGHQTKTQKNKSILSSPKIAPDVLADLGALITTLGTDQLRAMQDLAREHERYWKRKNALVAQALRSE